MSIQSVIQHLEKNGCKCQLNKVNKNLYDFVIDEKNYKSILKKESKTFELSRPMQIVVTTDSSDANFIALYVPNFIDITNTLQKKKALKFIQMLNMDIKVTKFLFTKQSKNRYTVSAGIELFLPTHKHMIKVIERCLSCLLRSCQYFEMKLDKELE